MPEYTIQAPDGRTYSIRGPAGATRDQIIAHIRARFPQSENGGAQALAGAQSALGDQSGPLDRFALGVGKGLSDTLYGALQLIGANPQKVGLSMGTPATDKALGAAGGLGDLTAQGLLMAVPGGAGADAARALGASARLAPAIGAALESGALSGLQPAADAKVRATNAAEGAGAGALGAEASTALGKIADEAAREGPRAMSAAKRSAIALARKYGIPLRVRDVTDSRFLHGLAAGVSQFPLSGASGKLRAVFRAFTRAAAKDAGIDADELSEPILKKRAGEISAGYDALFARNNITLGPDDLQKLADIGERARKYPTSVASPSINALIGTIGQAAQVNGGTIPGREWQDLVLADVNRLLSSTDPVVRDDAMDVRNVMMDAARRDMGPKDAAELDRLQNQTRSLKILQGAIVKRAAGATGFVSPQALWALTHTRFGASQRMRDLAAIGQNVLKADPSSFTAERFMGAYPFLRALGVGEGGIALHSFAPDLLKYYAGLAAAGATAGRVLDSDTAARAVAALEASGAMRKPAGAAARTLAPLAPLAAGAAGAQHAANKPLVIDITAPQKGPNTYTP